MSCAIGASGTGTDSTSQNGCLICGTSPLIQTSAAPRKTQVNTAIFHLLLVLTSAVLQTVRPSSRCNLPPSSLTLVGVALFPAKEAHSFVIIDVLRAINDGNHFLLWYKWPHRDWCSGQLLRGRSPQDSNHTRPQITRLTSARCSHDSLLMPYRLYPIFRRNSLRTAISAGPSTPLGGLPSITPMTPRPCSVFATITSTGLAVAQKIEHTSGMFCTTFSRFMGYALRRMRTNTCPAPRA